MVAVDNLHKPGIDPARKAHMGFDCGAVLCHRCLLGIGHNLHCMRIPHRDHCEFDGFAIDWHRP